MDQNSFPLRISYNIDIQTNGAREGLLISTGIISGIPQEINGTLGVNNKSLWPSVFSPMPTAVVIPSLSLNDKNVTELSKNINQQSNEQSKILSPLVLSLPGIEEKQQQFGKNNIQCFSGSLTSKKDCCSSPILFDSTTTTTSLEVFRPESASSSNIDFYQLPKAPLSRGMIREPPVVLVPARGEEYEYNEKSETHFSAEGASPLKITKSPPLQQKSVHWGESICIQPSPLPSTSTTPSAESLPSSSNSFHCSQRFPIQIGETSPIEEPSVSSPILKEISDNNQTITSPTIIRRQRQEHNELRLNSPSPERDKNCPPRPPKCWLNKNAQSVNKGQVCENIVPPLPPKPEHLQRRREAGLKQQYLHQRSQSIDDQLGRHFQPQTLRNINSSNDIVKLYQTRDCLGRIVCEW